MIKLIKWQLLKILGGLIASHAFGFSSEYDSFIEKYLSMATTLQKDATNYYTVSVHKNIKLSFHFITVCPFQFSIKLQFLPSSLFFWNEHKYKSISVYNH